jgi:hypothetical protein
MDLNDVIVTIHSKNMQCVTLVNILDLYIYYQKHKRKYTKCFKDSDYFISNEKGVTEHTHRQ